MESFYLTKEFARLARRSRLADDQLQEAVDRAEAGTVDADLGGGLVKQRVAQPGKGRSGGFRTVLAYRRGKRAIFLHLFAKARRANLAPAELETYQKLAKAYDRLSDDELDALVATRGWRKVKRKDGEEEELS
ncbi:MAG: type II toxin-antitoxin system RelE/ParE family toxin [Alphaproteobacteria bacterium]|nr:type II toxin-antitoxin system RelE/ParE family toxin [Alphaproteobacteria bacterium]